MCPLIRKGVTGAHTERSRSVDNENDTQSGKEEELEAMITRMVSLLPFGSTALLRVDPASYAGQYVVPVIVGDSRTQGTMTSV